MHIGSELVAIDEHISSIILDIRYATTSNFTHQKLYKQPKVFLRQESLVQLVTAADDLERQGYSLVIFDAFRPPRVQERLRSYLADDKYVADVSNHCMGIAVDVTLADARGGYLDMGTEYDDFTEKAHSQTQLIDAHQASNRAILKDALESVGFVQHVYEWWHFDYMPNRDWQIIPDNTNSMV